jgi:hypothetical protein
MQVRARRRSLVLLLACGLLAVASATAGGAQPARAAHRAYAVRHCHAPARHRNAPRRHRRPHACAAPPRQPAAVAPAPVSAPALVSTPIPTPPVESAAPATSPDFLRRPVPVDGPICSPWGISLPCRCPEVGRATSGPGSPPPGDGWLEVTLAYPGFTGKDSCYGGVSIAGSGGAIVASAGYTPATSPADGAVGIPSGAPVWVALAPGSWTLTAYAGREATASRTVAIAAGQTTALAVELP